MKLRIEELEDRLELAGWLGGGEEEPSAGEEEGCGGDNGIIIDAP